MLERHSFAVLSQKFTQPGSPRFAIADADSGDLLGSAVGYHTFPTSLLRRFFSNRLFPASFEIREKPDDSLLASIMSLGVIVQPRLEVRDALGSLVGSLSRLDALWHNRLLVYDRYDQRFAAIEGRFRDRDFRFVGEKDALELAVVSHQPLSRELVQRSFPGSTLQYHLHINRCLDDQPLAKMLILAISLAAA